MRAAYSLGRSTEEKPMDAVVAEIAVECRSEATALWGSIADTERLNRAAGLGKISVRPLSDTSAARFLVKTRVSGLPIEFEERPFEWVYPESYRVLRKMRSGAAALVELRYRLTPKPDGGTTVTVRLASTPRFALLRGILWFVVRRSLRGLSAAIQQIDADLGAGYAGHPRIPRAAVNIAALDRATQALVAFAPEDLALRLVRFVKEADDVEVGRIRPFALADAWGVDRAALLAACLAAVRAGLFELRWGVLCPSCRGPSEELHSLSALADHGACQLCEISFAVDLDETVEATFAVAPAVRAIDIGPYCISGPALMPHVLAQAILPRHGEARLKCPNEAGSYRIFRRGGAAAPLEIVHGANAEIHTCTTALHAGSPITAAPAATLVIDNPGDKELHAKIERTTWADQAATARVVVTMPGFRRDFSQDVLRPGMALKVARVGLFFSDLTGSTQLYTDAGDATAFKLVHDHFDMVIGLIEKSRGTLVKTIGDAVMAAFADDLDALIASVAILHAFEDFRRESLDRERTHIKLGVYGGACYVVTANNVLDYFGQTVNIAARLQSEAKGGELVVTAELAERALVAKAIPETCVQERYQARLKGVQDPIAAARIRLPRG
jgi:class 3 adenylate cyclase